MPTIHVTDRGGTAHTVQVDNGLTLMEPLRELDEGVEALCGGMCSCATCHVFVDEAWLARLPPRQGDEQEILQEIGSMRPGSRLSCQLPFTEALDGLKVTVAPDE